ncbi:MAG: hypothetical protein Q4G20_09415 [Paracoccus sp. (in: a-proteobacteria)]|nr:hypothetical protein [Paracoccus sp. (in: a-proteobacteria)]MDO5648138.1 hypothetical protein [Paracoccus sp. (in: a-proteobacteria)]
MTAHQSMKEFFKTTNCNRPTQPRKPVKVVCGRRMGHAGLRGNSPKRQILYAFLIQDAQPYGDQAIFKTLWCAGFWHIFPYISD